MTAREIITRLLMQLGDQFDIKSGAQMGRSLEGYFERAKFANGMDAQMEILTSYVAGAGFFSNDWADKFTIWQARGAGWRTGDNDQVYKLTKLNRNTYITRVLKGNGRDVCAGPFMIWVAYLVEYALESNQKEAFLFRLLEEYFEVDLERLRAVLALKEHLFAFITTYALMRAGHTRDDQERQLIYYRDWAAAYTKTLNPAREHEFVFELRTLEEVDENRKVWLERYYNALWEKYHQLKRRDQVDTDPVSLSRRFVLQKFKAFDERDRGLAYPTLPRKGGSQFQRMIVGPSGTGKTSFLHSVILAMICGKCDCVPELDRKVFRDYSEKLFGESEVGCIPLFVRGLIFGRTVTGFTEETASETLFRCAWTLSKVDDECIRDDMEGITPLERDIPDDLLTLFRTAAREGKLMLIMDAYDEAADRPLLLRYLQRFATDYPKADMLITSRPLGKENLKVSRWDIHFGDEQKKELICRWCSSNADSPHVCEAELTKEEHRLYLEKCSYLEDNHLKKDFAYNPYLLTTFLFSVESNCSLPDLLSSLEMSILQKMVMDDVRFGGGVMQRLNRDGLNGETLLREFQSLAYESLFILKYGNRVTEEQINRLVAKALGKENLRYIAQHDQNEERKNLLLLYRLTIQREGIRVSQLFSTQPGLLVAGEDTDFMFLSDLFLCHMAVERMMKDLRDKPEDEKQCVRQAICELEGIKDNTLYANTCTILVFALRDGAVDEGKKRMMLEAVIRSMVCRLACVRERSDVDQLLTGICDMLLGRYAANELNAGHVDPSIEGVVRWCREVLLLNVLPRVQGRTDLESGYVASFDELMHSVAAIQTRERLKQFGYLVTEN